MLDRLFKFTRNTAPSASVAKERLQLIIARESSSGLAPELMRKLEKEIIALIAKYIPVAQENITMNLQNQGNAEILELNVVFDKAPDSRVIT